MLMKRGVKNLEWFVGLRARLQKAEGTSVVRVLRGQREGTVGAHPIVVVRSDGLDFEYGLILYVLGYL